MRLWPPLVCVVVALAGCGAGEPERREAAPAPKATLPAAEPAATERIEPSVRPTRRPSCQPGQYRELRTSARALAAVVRESARAYRVPDGASLGTFGHMNVNGVPMVLGILGERVDADCDPAWYRVQLPRKPNGIVGWVRAGDVDVETVRTRIVVDLSERRVTLFRDGEVYLSTTAAIGSPATPTPTGRYYVNQRLRPYDPNGPFGPGAIGVSAFSEVLTGWVQGGPIAIHGTNRPDSIGQAVSNGCIRVENSILLRMWDVTLSGTPVVIRA